MMNKYYSEALIVLTRYNMLPTVSYIVHISIQVKLRDDVQCQEKQTRVAFQPPPYL